MPLLGNILSNTYVPDNASFGGDYIMYGSLASRPAASIAGRIYIVADAGDKCLYRDNGTSWDHIHSDWTHLEGKPDLATQAELDTHVAAADPHAVYQRENEKGVANGYAGLDALGLVPIAQLPGLPPTPHAATHRHLGTDEIATATPTANAIPKAGIDGKLASGWLPASGSGDAVESHIPLLCLATEVTF